MEEVKLEERDAVPSGEEISQILETKGPFNPQEQEEFLSKFDEGKLGLREKFIGLFRFAAAGVSDEEGVNFDSVSREIVKGYRTGREGK